MYTKHMTATKFYFPWGATMLKISDLAPRPYRKTRVQTGEYILFLFFATIYFWAKKQQQQNYHNIHVKIVIFTVVKIQD